MANKLTHLFNRPVGFSTGCLFYKMDIYGAEAIQMIGNYGHDAIEVIFDDIGRLKRLMKLSPLLKEFSVKSVHLPFGLRYRNVKEIRILLGMASEFYQEIGASLAVVHPDDVEDYKVFRNLPMRLAVENMDKGSAAFNFPDDFTDFFAKNPQWQLVLDINHCCSHDRSLQSVGAFVDRYSERLAEIHLSGVGIGGNHIPLHKNAQAELIKCIPAGVCPIIIESPLDNPHKDLAREIDFIASVLGR